MSAEDRKPEVPKEIDAPAEEMEAEIENREGGYVEDERAEQEDLNQGIDTGTHDSVRRGVKWPASYRIRGTSQPKPKP